MKKQLAIAAALACSGAYAVSYVTGPAFTNLDFSSGTSGWGLYSDGGSFSISTTGGAGVLTKNSDNGDWNTGILYQCVPVTVGQKVALNGGKWSGTMATGGSDGFWAEVSLYTIPNPDLNDAASFNCVDYQNIPGTCKANEFQAAVDYGGNIEYLTNGGNNNAAGVTLTSGHAVAINPVDGSGNLLASWTDKSIFDSPYNYAAVKAAMGAGWSDNQRVNYDSITTITSEGFVVLALKYGTGPGYENFGNVSFSGLQVVPEPASLGLLALGAMAFLGRRRK
jgi:hypothetical protein